MRNVLFRTLMAGALVVTGAVASVVSAPANAASKVQEVVSPGGITAYLIEAPAVPFFSLSFQFKGGASLDPDDKLGLATMVAGLLDEGAGDLDSGAFQQELEDKAIRLSFSAERDNFTGRLKTLTKNKARAGELLKLALTKARFDDEPVERVRSQLIAAAKRRSEDPNQLASSAFFETAFPDHVYGRERRGTVETLSAITVDDLRAFEAERLAKDNLLIGVAGDISAEDLGVYLDEVFGSLRDAAAPVDIADIEPQGQGTVVVDKAVPQSVVSFGQAGFARKHPDFYTAYVANHILGGGGFSSRLMDEIREKRGLAYGAYSYLAPLDHAPLWMGGVATNNADVAESIRLVKQEVGRMAAGDISQEELDDAKTFLTGSFPLRLTSNDQVAQMLVGMQDADLGANYIEERNGFIDAVTLEDVKRVAAELYDPEALLFVVVGQPEGLLPG